ncbi:hypothetical protein Pint_21811 [Pistacia integerrima]|uniref:Uncharacterized protein n=1 Tax=Pistacia integerrima TaxID=434235 RepID=A0ACC0XCN9_9ROSI|nr:hypothetical protein Pint_21811 [Pistacia integerrima]
MALHLLVYLQIILLLSPIKASRQKCQDICGNFHVWYPFGIGEGCYFDKWLSPNQAFDGRNILSNLPQLQGCTKSPFVADKDWVEADYLFTNHSDSVLRDKVVPVSLHWGKKNREMSDYYQGCSGDLICNTTGNSNCSRCPDGYSLSPYKTYQEFQCSSKSLNHILKINAQVKFSIIIGRSVAVGMLPLLIGAWWLYKFIKRRKAIKLKQIFFKRNGGFLLKQRLASNSEGNIVKTKLFTSKELKKVTDKYNTNRILGQGGQGTVYKGMLAEG